VSENYDQDQSDRNGVGDFVLYFCAANGTEIVESERFIRLCWMCLLIAALWHFLQNILAPILMSLSAAKNPHR
jgi:E3 ubiquitin-protein ligase RNF139